MNLFVFGLGFSARRFAERERARFDTVRATVTEPERAGSLAAETGFIVRAFGPETDDPCIADNLADTDILLISAPPGQDGDTVLARYRDAIAKSRIRWIGYLSTIGVYGDHGGAWIDETTPATPKAPAPAAASKSRTLGLRSAPRPARQCRCFASRASTAPAATRS
ncbi:hypothetical protein GCM10025880_53940 [Methylorubrum aminovorans]|nr:hypothetical protein GCM10025880_53940 [Methylorubrum aminovorans]